MNVAAVRGLDPQLDGAIIRPLRESPAVVARASRLCESATMSTHPPR